jgi:hypothetical protein
MIYRPVLLFVDDFHLLANTLFVNRFEYLHDKLRIESAQSTL